MKQLEELLSGTFCIVGNSPKELGTGNGPRIDSYDTVIRFKNYDLSGEYAKDYGTKTTVFCTPFNKTQFYRSPDQYESICCTLPINVKKWKKKYSGLQFKMVKEYDDQGFLQYIPVDIFEELRGLYKKGRPSSGITTLWWIYKITGKKIPKSDVFGFSFFDTKEKHHYYKKHIRLQDPNKKISPYTRKKLEKIARACRKGTARIHIRQYELEIFNTCTY